MARLLWLLPKAAPALLRHCAAYADLAALDLARARRQMMAQLLAVAAMLICWVFAAMLGCLAIIAYTWDTPHRVGTIAGMAGGFLLLGLASALYRANLSRRNSPLFSAMRKEWQEDSVILERILAGERE